MVPLSTNILPLTGVKLKNRSAVTHNIMHTHALKAYHTSIYWSQEIVVSPWMCEILLQSSKPPPLDLSPPVIITYR